MNSRPEHAGNGERGRLASNTRITLDAKIAKDRRSTSEASGEGATGSGRGARAPHFLRVIVRFAVAVCRCEKVSRRDADTRVCRASRADKSVRFTALVKNFTN